MLVTGECEQVASVACLRTARAGGRPIPAPVCLASTACLSFESSTMNSRLEKAISRHLIRSLDKQIYLDSLLASEGHRPHYDAGSGLLCVGPQHKWQTQILGAEFEQRGIWLWGWADAFAHHPPRLYPFHRTLQEYGERHDIAELTTPEVSLDLLDSHTLALLATDVCEANGYYLHPFEGGTFFMLVADDKFPNCPDPPLLRITAIFPRALSSLDIPDHRLALAGYLDYYNLTHEQVDDKLVVKENGDPVLTATFDEQNRLTHMEANLKPAASSEGDSDAVESWEEGQLRRMMGW